MLTEYSVCKLITPLKNVSQKIQFKFIFCKIMKNSKHKNLKFYNIYKELWKFYSIGQF